MRAGSLVLPLFAAVALGALALTPLPAGARPLPCSGQPDIWHDSDVIVGGWFFRWRPEQGANTAQQYEVEIDMTVEQVFKGKAPGQISLVETLLFRRPGQPPGQEWMGGGPACGAFDFDPTGSYGILGLKDNGDGTYRASSLLRLYIGPEPSGPGYERALARLAPFAPEAGNAGLARHTGGQPASWAAWASLAALMLVAPAFAVATVAVARMRR
ncbi:hypothetical protein EDM76_10435 [bacterium]|nr:MAG: hypothetical protein EDM76_10435 [bacterium]MCL4230437.1 hypothetical protein [Dehalococcoidia bacterium]